MCSGGAPLFPRARSARSIAAFKAAQEARCASIAAKTRSGAGAAPAVATTGSASAGMLARAPRAARRECFVAFIPQFDRLRLERPTALSASLALHNREIATVAQHSGMAYSIRSLDRTA